MLVPQYVLFYNLGWIRTFNPIVIAVFFVGGATGSPKLARQVHRNWRDRRGTDAARADMEAHFTFKPKGLPRKTVYFADSTGIEYKLQRVLNKFPDLGGVAIWGIGGEDSANWNVLPPARQPNCNLSR